MISSRFLPAIGALLAFAFVPTYIHSYAGLVVNDGRTTSRISTTLAGFTSTPTRRSRDWGQQKFGTDDWIERRYVADRHQAVVTVIRSYDLKRLYHHPELGVAYGTDFRPVTTLHLAERSSVPVHLLETRISPQSVAIYVLYCDQRFVESPILFQLQTASELLLSGRKPMTLFFLHDLEPPAGGEIPRPSSVSLLLAAIDDFLAQKTP